MYKENLIHQPINLWTYGKLNYNGLSNPILFLYKKLVYFITVCLDDKECGSCLELEMNWIKEQSYNVKANLKLM